MLIQRRLSYEWRFAKVRERKEVSIKEGWEKVVKFLLSRKKLVLSKATEVF